MYLLAQFELTDEIEDMDFDENKPWLNRKLLTLMVVLRGNDKSKTWYNMLYFAHLALYTYLTHLI